MHRILLADPISPKGVEVLREGGFADVEGMPKDSPPEALRAKLREGFDALVVRSATRATREVLEAGLPRLRAVGRAGVGVDNVDVEAASRMGIAVLNVPDGNTVSAAEHTMALLLSLARHVPQSFASLKDGRWERAAFTGIELNGKTLGLVGLGRIGAHVARAARGFGMRVLAHDPYTPASRAEALGVEPADFERVLRESDFVSVHVPLTDATRGLLGAEAFAKMKPTARVINCARGGIVDEAALHAALTAGKLAGAALDVFVEEPPKARHPLLDLPNVVATPHLGAATGEAQEQVGIQIAHKLRKFLLEGTYEDAVNVPFRRVPEEWKPFFDLAERMGAFHFQMADEPVRRARLEYCGEGLDEWKPLVCAYLKGLLDPMTEGGVNWVNALPRAAERGIAVEESRARSGAAGYANLLRVTLITERGTELTLAGTLVERAHPRLVEMNGYRMDVEPRGNLLLIENMDKPGALGRTATLLGEHGLNIAECRLGRRERAGVALDVIALDEEAPDAVLDALRAVPEVLSVRRVRL